MRTPTVIVRGEVLESWLTLSEVSRSQLAAELNISKGRVSQLLSSGGEPSAHLIAKLMGMTNLSFDRLFKIVRSAQAGSSSVRSFRKARVLELAAGSRTARR